MNLVYLLYLRTFLVETDKSLILKCYPAGIYLLKVNKRNTRTRCEICSALTIKTSERLHSRSSGLFIVNFEHISHLVLLFFLFTLSRWMPSGYWVLINAMSQNDPAAFTLNDVSQLIYFISYTTRCPRQTKNGRYHFSKYYGQN